MKILILLFLIFNFLNLIKSYNQLPNSFNLLGPFTEGEREDFDTIESYGGIFNILIGDNTKYPSELGNNGVVGWNFIKSETNGSLAIDWSDTIDWNFLQSVWGWSIWLWYGWAVSESFTVEQSGNYIISCSGTRQYFLQNQFNKKEIYEFNGDFYGYGVGQQFIQLNQSTPYALYVKMSSSVRLNQSPNSQFTCQLSEPIDQSIIVLESETLVSDLINNQLVSPFGSITIFNSGLETIESIDLSVPTDQQNWIKVNYLDSNSQNILSGQKLSLPFSLTLNSNEVQNFDCPFQAILNLKINGNQDIVTSTNLTFNCTQWGNPYLYTFLDYDQTIQYSIALPPLNPCNNNNNNGNSSLCGIMLGTHGAGVESSSSSWMEVLPRQNNYWILLPTGRRSWGYDWESSSRLNVFNSIEYFTNNLPGIPNNLKFQYQIDSEKILFFGHSMGGHGCISLTSHFGDLAIGAACAAGFVKLQFYVFFNTRSGFSYIDPSLHGILMASIAENDNDLYTSNLVGIPLMVRYGQNDSNVNPWHSRRIARMVSEQSQNESAVIISEVPNENHWFDGILNDQFMLNYYKQLQSTYNNYQPEIPKLITITTHNPASSGTRANIQILQTINPSRSAKIQILQSKNSNNQLIWILSTQNVRRFGIKETPIRINGLPVQLIIDGQQFKTDYYPSIHYCRLDKWLPDWNITNDQTWMETEKSPLTYGPIRMIFEKNFQIIIGTNVSLETLKQFEWSAVYISNFFNTYGRGSPKIFKDIDFIPSSECSSNDNYILLGNNFQNLITNKFQSQVPIQFNDDNSFSVGPSPVYNNDGNGIAFISPNQCGQGLLLTVAGYDNSGFNNIIHTLPQRSGILVPDFIVIGNDYKWKSVGGILSTGFFTSSWQIETDSSYFSLSSNFS